MRIVALVLALICAISTVDAQSRGGSVQDPYLLANFPTAIPYTQTAGLTVRSPTINPAQKTLIYFAMGQSNRTNINPTTFVPTHASQIDNFNVYDGTLYSINGAVLGAAWYPTSSVGIGNLVLRVAENLIANAPNFDRVIVVPLALPGTSANDWANGVLANRGTIALARLANRGITCSMTGVTCMIEWGLGETDNLLGTSQANFVAWSNQTFAAMTAAGFTGRIFIPKETWNAGSTSATIQAAQVALRDSVTKFNGGDLDTLDNTNRFDTTHFNDTGAAAAATLIYNAIHASGAPF